MRLIRLLAAGAVIGGAVVFIKRLMEEQAEQGTAPPQTESPAQPSRTEAAGSSSSNGGEPTKAELYERAQELGIEGRSKMSKRELLRAIEAAG